ncbi:MULTISPECIES: efflux transporter outer membrane subunit [unclassified Pseudomonas]|uniref:efflux transporter outer membrane subunit n=1 Tax=unclassified Pseudomonas TaxID=196821 RepID=UPI00047F8DD9|nr:MULTISPECIES: efflux transporter outer membrane subunit [unclassified Pseudomonas]PXX64541.1 multidrug efflux system outer membrane protein [Pseudomonas sp. LAIL14HWK12:I1]SMD12328.1 outer membrane protein, multidrug efflux system [Pseudomonas sp. URIL14HWK12:I5]SOC98441.1 outer membrane protein, multidrug efflux system [Pseudomonas sp. LAIL14HWK12:I3]
MRLEILGFAIVAALGGCSFIPDYVKPEPPVPAVWPQGDAYQASSMRAAALVGWKQFFKDQSLHQLIDIALESNRDLRKAALNVAAYRAQYQIQRAELAPEVGLDGGAGRSRVPADLSPTQRHETTGNNSVAIGLTSYELDVWGRVRSLSASAAERYLATEEAERSVLIGLVADVSTAYLTWQTDNQLLAVTKDTLANYRHNLDLIEQSSAVGTASDLDVRQARTLVDSARGQVQAYRRQVAQDMNALRLLLGAEIPTGLNSSGLDSDMLAALPVGLPSDLLLQRPDIQAAEHALQAANADIGAARAAFLPRVTLTANAGTASNQLSGLFDSGSESWSFIPQINLPIFTGGRLKASLDYAKIQKDINVANYEQTIQVAFREVSDGLAGTGTWQEQVQSQRDLVRSTDEYTQMAQQRYDEGVDNYLTLLDAQRQQLSARQKLLTDQLEQLKAQIQLFKALGGGWNALEVVTAH